MTAEIGILNRQCVALAADSAVTIGIQGKQKVLNSANKLFNLVKGLPVGLMVYGRGDFLGVPWEVIVNEYRKDFNKECIYDSLEDYANDFINKLNNVKFISDSSYKGYVDNLIATYMIDIAEQTKEILSEKYPNVEVKPDTVLEEFKCILDKKAEELSELKFAEKFVEDDIKKIISNKITIEVAENNFYRLFNINDYIGEYNIKKLVDSTIEKIVYISALIQTKDIFFNYSGIVITGFGEEELFPVLHEYYIEGIVNNKLKYRLNKVTKIYAESGEEGTTSEITPFAQQEMVHSILTGIDPGLESMIFQNLNEVINRTLSIVNDEFQCEECEKKERSLSKIVKKAEIELKNMLEFINVIRRENFINPVLEMVDLLPKDELATMAETLVNITSFKRKITMDTETVGGPIDVAIISKSEGFIWIKRKHYFKQELNRDYFNK